MANDTADFKLQFEITTGPLKGQRIVLTGTKKCMCSPNSCSGTEDSVDPNLPFYGVIGSVGCLIAIVILAVVLYHCIMCRTLVTQRRTDEEEE